jgi:DNA-binding IclR family transcriptional regulator
MNTPQGISPTYRNQAAGRVLKVLGAFLGHDRPRGVSELARELGFNKNMVHRALATLVSENFLARDPSGELYQLGYRWLAFAISEASEFDIVALARPYLEQLHALTGESVYLSIIVGRNRVTVDDIQARGQRVLRSRRGDPVPLHCTKMSRVLLAHLSDEDVDDYLKAASPLKRTLAFPDPPSRSRNGVWRDIREIRAVPYVLWRNPIFQRGLRDPPNSRCTETAARDHHHRRSARTVRSRADPSAAAAHRLHPRAARNPCAIVSRHAVPARSMSSSARRALKILAAVGDSGRPMGVTEIARTLGIAPGTAFRGLDALQAANLLARHPSAPRYVLGPAALGLRQSLLSLFRIRDVCLPYLRQLASMSGETCSLHVRIAWYSARIATAPGMAEVTSGAILSGAEPLSANVAGRAILAHLERNQIARHLTWATRRGMAIPEGFERELAAIRARGFAHGSSLEAGVMAFPIRKAEQALAAVAIEGSAIAGSSARNHPIPEWREIARAIETLVRANPALSHQPFGHFVPDDVVVTS